MPRLRQSVVVVYPRESVANLDGLPVPAADLGFEDASKLLGNVVAVAREHINVALLVQGRFLGIRNVGYDAVGRQAAVAGPSPG